jgi:hypothetical protein
MNTQNLSANALSMEQTNQVKGGYISCYPPNKPIDRCRLHVVYVHEQHKNPIVSAAKSVYSAGKKTYNFVKSWF